MNNLTVNSDVVLTSLQANDAQTLFTLVDKNRLHLRTWLPWLDFTTRIEDSVEFIARSQQQLATRTGMVNFIRYHDRPVGVIGFNYIDGLHKVCEIGYWLDQDHQGLGIMTNSLRSSIEYAFTHLEMNKVNIPVATENVRSRSVPERLGFTIEGRSRDAEWLYDHYVDHILYAMLKSEWTTTS